MSESTEVSRTVGRMVANAPWPSELEDLVARARCYPGWTFRLEQGTYDDGQVTQLRLIITVRHHDSYHAIQHLCGRCSQPYPTRHTAFHYPVPMVAWDRASWQRWLRDRVADVHVHEDGEALAFEYGGSDINSEEQGRGAVRKRRFLERPFAPQHGPGRDPNRQVEVGVDPMEQRVAQDGGRYPGWWVDPERRLLHDDEVHDRCVQVDGGRRCRPVQLVDEIAPGEAA